jgi:hypothetical protein
LQDAGFQNFHESDENKILKIQLPDLPS